MSRPIQEKSISNATSTTSGSEVQLGGRTNVSMFVVADNLDTGLDTLDVQLEASMNDGSDWAVLRDEGGNQIGNVTISEFNDPGGDGTFAAYITIHGVASDTIRARITAFTDSSGSDLSVDVIIGASNNPETSSSYRSV